MSHRRVPKHSDLPGRIAINQEQYIRAIVDNYHTNIGIRSYGNVPIMSEYRYSDAVSISDKHTAFVSNFPYSR